MSYFNKVFFKGSNYLPNFDMIHTWIDIKAKILVSGSMTFRKRKPELFEQLNIE